MHRHAILLAASLLALFTAAGCGSDTTSTTDGTGGGVAGTSGSGGAGGSGDPCAGHACGDPCTTCPEGAPCMPQACNAEGQCVDQQSATCGACPTAAPDDGTMCEPVGLVCETEDGIVLVCRERVTCTMDGWKKLVTGCKSDPEANPACPNTPPAGACDAIADPTADPSLCEFSDTFCGCSNCLGGPCGGQGEWVCAEAPKAPCPAIAPKLGAPCTEDALKCVYGACPLGGTTGGRTCTGGLWTEDIVQCPQ
jgi:hypothetical protein